MNKKYCPLKTLPEWKELERLVPDYAYSIWELNNSNGVDRAPNGEPSMLFLSLLDHYNGDRDKAIIAKAKLYSRAFKEWFGDWTDPEAADVSKVVDENGEPLVVYHGSASLFNEFDFEKLGSVTGSGYYTDKYTGEEIKIDSSYAFFFTNSKNAAYSYRNMGVWNNIEKHRLFYENLRTFAKLGKILHGAKDLDFLQEQRLFIDNVVSPAMGYDVRKALNGKYITDDQRESLILKINKTLSRIKDLPNAVAISNHRNNLSNKIRHFEILRENKQSLINNKPIDRYNFSKYVMTFSKGYDFLTVGHNDNAYYIAPKLDGTPGQEIITELNIDNVFRKISQYIDESRAELHQREKDAGFDKGYVIPVFLNVKNPLLHDYNYSSFPDTYKIPADATDLNATVNIISQKLVKPAKFKDGTNIPTAYVAARLVKKAIAEGYDGVVYENVVDPFEMTSYGIFSANQVKSVDNRGTYSTEDNNIYNSLQLRSFPQKLRDQKLIHKYKGAWYITKERYNNPQEYESLVQYIDKEAAISDNLVEFVSTRLGTRVVFMEKAVLHDKLPLSNAGRGNYNSVEKLLYFLHDRFPNLEFEVVPQSQAKYKNQNAWIEGNKIYLVEDRFTDEIAIHEALHPFVSALYMDNKALFKHLFEEAKLSYPKLWDQILSTYTEKGMSNVTRALELVAQALAREFNVDHSKAPKGRSFWLCAKMFIDWIKDFFIDFATVNNGIVYIDHTNLPKMTLSQLAKLLNTNDTKFNINADANQVFNSLSLHNSALSKLDKQFEVVKVSMQQRLNSLLHYKNKNLKVIQLTALLVQKLHELDSKQGMIEFIRDALLKVQEAYKYISDESNKINYRQLVLLLRDLLGFYIPAINSLVSELDTFSDIEGFTDDYYALKRVADDTERAFDKTIREYTLKIITDYQRKIGTPDKEIQQTIEWINNPFNDVGTVASFIGSAQMSSNVYVRIARRMLGDAENETARLTFQKGKHLVNLLNKARSAVRFKTTKSVENLLQEVDRDGKKTGNFVRDINYGQYYQDYDRFLQQLNEDLGVAVDEDGVPVFADDVLERKYRDALDRWKCLHGERPYKIEYYLAKNKHLSRLSREALDRVDKEIRDLLSPVTPDKGAPRIDKLSDVDFNRYVKLIKDKQLLYNQYNLDGTSKNGEELLIAQELSAFAEELRSKVKHNRDYDAFNTAKQAIIDEFGEDSDVYKRWIYVNTDIDFSEDFKLTRQLLGQASKINKIANDQADTYRELIKIRSNILRYYRKYRTLAPDVENMPLDIIKRVKLLDEDIAELRHQLITFAKVSGIKGDKIDDLDRLLAEHQSVERKTQYYKDLERLARLDLVVNPDALSQFTEDTSFESPDGTRKTYSLYEYSFPMFEKDVVRELPNRLWSMLDAESEWVNPNFDRSAGNYVQPKRSMYDNSESFELIEKFPELKQLYDELISTMSESNGKISFFDSTDNYRLPQISGRFMTILRRNGNVFKNIKHHCEDEMNVLNDDVDYVEKATIRPDGTPLYNVPTRFIGRLKDPNMITADVVGSVIAYFEMAENFHSKSSLADELELHRYFLRKEVRENAGLVQRGLGYLSEIPGLGILSNLAKDTKAVDKYEKLLEMQLYGRKKKQVKIGRKGKKQFNVSKAIAFFQNWTRHWSLGFNIHPAIGGAIAARNINNAEAAAKKYFTGRDLAFARSVIAINFPEMVTSIGNAASKNKLVQLMLMNQILKNISESFSDLDMSQISRAVYQNAVMGHFTATDFVVKGEILLSAYNNYRLIDTPSGKRFMSLRQYISLFYPTNSKKGELEFYKTKVNLYDVFLKNKDTGVLEIALEYKEYVTKELLNEVTNKILSLSQRADGTLTELDKAHIHQDAFASFATIHKNWLIVGYEMLFMSEKFNYQTMEYEGGRLRKMIKTMWRLIRKYKCINVKEWWSNATEFEKTSLKYLSTLFVFYWCSRLISGLAKEAADDDEDNLFLNSVAYDMTRGTLEISSIYNPVETNNTLKTISVSTGLIENIFNIIFDFEAWGEEMERGPYEDMHKKGVLFIKITPFKNIYEGFSPQGVRSKQTYLESQIQF